MKRLSFLILMLPVFLAAGVYNLDQLIEYGLKNSYSMQQNELSATSSSSSLKTAKWNLLPEAEVNANVKQDFNPIAPQSGLSSSAGFSLSKTISLNDAAYFNYRNAFLDRQSAELRLNQGYSDYAYQVFAAYMEALTASKRRSSLQENLAIQTRVWEQSKVLLQLGKTTPFEVKQNEIAMMNSRISILQLENTISTARSKLFALVQMQDEGNELMDIEATIDKSMPEFSTSDVTELKLLEQELKHSDLSLTQSKLDNFPRVSLGYNFSRNVGGADFDFDTYTTSHGVNLSLSYSLWNHFRNTESTTRTKITKQMAMLNLEDTTDQLKRDYDIMNQELQYLVRLDDLYSEKLDQSTEQIKQAEERYRLGLIQLLELDKTRTDYIDADIAYYANRYQIIIKQEAINKLLNHKILGKW
ncbi:MAG: TolC family protein [Candidatus Cloacimonas sp.]|jgi:outer membrane protein TolC|nr:TolC family protein [Candidatus Cloacimonas sp.]